MTDTAASSEKAKKPRQGRSPAYPGIDLKRAIEKAQALHDAEGNYAVPMPSAFAAWGYSAKSSGGRETRAALRYFGLITVEGDSETGKVRLTEKALRVLLDKREDQTERRALIRELALTPAVHKQLLSDYPMGIKSDASVIHSLVFDHSYNQSAASEIVAEFKATAAYAGLYEPDSMLDIKSGQSQAASTEAVQKEPPKIGDMIQAEIGGLHVFEKPKRVRAIQDHEGKPWVFVDDSETGVPMEQVEVVERGTGAPAASVQPPRLPLPSKDDEPEKAGVRRSRFPLAEGDVVVTFPENLSADSVEDLDGFWQVFIKKARREAGIK
ncbi:hypothetical protein [Bradyrhizobium centrosematis]|uniref:hypothetical protein n=1 Tax=Bradyrhizobium centrosematis TaxID=1300039 RepID=UPI00216700B8|nr:hypothetical protein [Bradyrhizobium centrosematis]MCS3758670.1 hypothetical protein [Bradyrhizobium centrosematis]MCS3773442.1 hypothetical protein [Bradyrhizobium centrosematis]